MLAVDGCSLDAESVRIGQAAHQRVDGGHDGIHQLEVARAVSGARTAGEPRAALPRAFAQHRDDGGPVGQLDRVGLGPTQALAAGQPLTQFDELLSGAHVHHNATTHEHRAMGIGQIASLRQH